jgi:hypothetical protein
VLRAVLGGGVCGAGIVLMFALGFVPFDRSGDRHARGDADDRPWPRRPAARLGEASIGKYLPSNAGQAFLAVEPSDALLSPSAGSPCSPPGPSD